MKTLRSKMFSFCKLAIVFVAGVIVGLQFNLWHEDEFRSYADYGMRRFIGLMEQVANEARSASNYISIEVTENGLPLPGYKGYRDGWRDAQAAYHRADIEAQKTVLSEREKHE